MTWALLVCLHGVYRYLNSECSLVHVSFMAIINNFTSVIEDLKLLIQQKNKKEQEYHNSLEFAFSTFCEDIKPLYQSEKQKLFNQISSFREKYFFLKNISILECLKKHDNEIFHSKLLAFIWSNNQKIFSDFILSIPQLSDNEQLRSWILNASYKVEVEAKTKNGKFIDLIIMDNQKRWCIVIENKINSKVSPHGDKLQLDSYSAHVNRTMPKDTMKYYLLLSYRNNKKYTLKNEWIYVDYYSVFRSIIKNYSTEDEILKQYLMTVFALLFRSKEIGQNINEETSIIEMSLFYQNIITQIK